MYWLLGTCHIPSGTLEPATWVTAGATPWPPAWSRPGWSAASVPPAWVAWVSGLLAACQDWPQHFLARWLQLGLEGFSLPCSCSRSQATNKTKRLLMSLLQFFSAPPESKVYLFSRDQELLLP